MYISARNREILELLLLYGEASKFDFINYFQISERTLRRDLNEINEYTRKFSLIVITKDDYLILQGEDSNKNKLNSWINSYDGYVFSSTERKSLLLYYLFYDIGRTLSDLSFKLNVSPDKINQELNSIKSEFPEEFSFQIEKAKGIVVLSNENQKRFLLYRYIYQMCNKSLSQFIFAFRVSDISINNVAILECVNISSLIEIEKRFRSIRSTLFNVSDEDYLKILLYFSISIERIDNGYKLEALNFSNFFENTLNRKNSLYTFIVSLLDEPVKSTSSSVIEINHLYNFSLDFTNQESIDTLNLENLAESLIQTVERRLKLTLKSRTLKEDLTNHLISTFTVSRENNQTFFDKKMITQIKNDYSNIYTIVKEELRNFFLKESITDDKVVYIVLHFGVALLELSEKRGYDLLVVCSSGMGTSKMISAILKRNIPEINSVDTVSVYNLFHEVDLTKYDLVVSTINLGEVPFSYIVISPVITEIQIKEIKNRLDQLEE
ncbi:BglG family transcription antiterminator [Enterococcus olivae]